MKVISSYISGLKRVINIKKIVFLTYFLNLVFALVVAIPFASALSSAIGFSDLLTPLASSFNFTAFSDFMREHGDRLSSIFSVARWLIPIYILLQVFLNGGIIGAYTKNDEPYSISDFYKNCTLYFWKYLMVFIGFLIFHIIALVIVVIPAAIILSGGIDSKESEIIYWTVSYWSLGIYFILFTLVMLVSDYTKILLTKPDTKGVFKTIFKAWKLVFQNILKMYSLLLINLLVISTFYWIYWQLGNIINPSSMSIALILLLIQQVMNLIRVSTKFAYYGSIVIMTKENS